jgi:hypothetical protein
VSKGKFEQITGNISSKCCVQTIVQIKPLQLDVSYMFRRLGKQCVATLVVDIARNLQLLLALSSMSYDDDECVSETSFALVLALWAPLFANKFIT